jgi:hypothetical protein
MPRHEIERILEARYEFDYANRESKAYHQKILYDLVDKAIAGTDISRYELLQSLHDRYLEFKRGKRKVEKVSLSQARIKSTN